MRIAIDSCAAITRKLLRLFRIVISYCNQLYSVGNRRIYLSVDGTHASDADQSYF